MTPQYIMHAGRIMRVRARCKTNGLPAVLVEDDGGARFIIPLTQAVEAEAPPGNGQRRAAVRLVVDNTRRM